MKTDYITQISNKLDNKKLYPIVSKLRKSYKDNLNKALNGRDNTIVWLHDTQEWSYERIAPLFDLKKSQIGNLYNEAKAKQGGLS